MAIFLRFFSAVSFVCTTLATVTASRWTTGKAASLSFNTALEVIINANTAIIAMLETRNKRISIRIIVSALVGKLVENQFKKAALLLLLES